MAKFAVTIYEHRSYMIPVEAANPAAAKAEAWRIFELNEDPVADSCHIDGPDEMHVEEQGEDVGP